MPRHASILRRKPRTRREQALIRLHTTPADLSRGWERLRHRRRHRAAQRRAQELFRHIGHGLHAETTEPAAPARRTGLHVRPHR